jgi:hypothetical protein
MQAHRPRKRAGASGAARPAAASDDRAPAPVTVSIEPISVEIEKAPELTGASRTRVFQAVREKQLTVRKAGKQSLVEVDELKRWVRSLPTRGRQPEQSVAAWSCSAAFTADQKSAGQTGPAIGIRMGRIAARAESRNGSAFSPPTAFHGIAASRPPAIVATIRPDRRPWPPTPPCAEAPPGWNKSAATPSCHRKVAFTLAFNVTFALDRAPEQSGRRLDLVALAKAVGASEVEVTQALAQLVAHGHLAVAGRKAGSFRLVLNDGRPRQKGGTEARSPLVPFPLAHRRTFVARLASQMPGRPHGAAEQHLQQQLKRQAQILRRRGFDERTIQQQLLALERAVRAELWRVVLLTPGTPPNGAA